jgi:hypothetical protein
MRNYFSIVIYAFAIIIVLWSCKKDNNTSNTANSKLPYRVGTQITFKLPVYGTSPIYDTVLFVKDTTIAGEKYLKGINKRTGNINMLIREDNDRNVYRYWPAGSINLEPLDIIYFKLGKPTGTSWDFTFSIINNTPSDSVKDRFTIVDNNATFSYKGQIFNDCIKVSLDQQTTSGAYSYTVTYTYIWSDKLGIVYDQYSFGTLVDYVY